MRFIFIFMCLIINSMYVSAQRNVVLIIADDLGTDYCGFYEGYKDTVPIPNIRKLLSKGVRFKNAFSNPVCSSTRTTALTGRYSFRTGVGGVVGGIGGSNQADTAEITIPKLLKRYNGNIAKADIGKWHLHQPSPIGNLQNPLRMGYDYFEGPFIGQLPSYTNWVKYTNGTASTVTTYATTENVNNALAWQKTQGRKPFFLWLAFNAPHSPYHLPPANLHTYTGLSGTATNIQQNPKLYFKAMLQALDTEIGRFTDSLRVRGVIDSTDFIFIGDNGNSIQTAQITNTDKAKGTVYDYGVHVPFIVSGPSVVNPGRASDAIINTTDIFATVLELMGHKTWQTQIPSNKPVDSKSLLPILKNQSNQVRPWVFSEIFKLTPDADDAKAMRTSEYKLIRFDVAGNEAFYNLVNDPDENTNLLTRPLSATELSNYNYLCAQMTTLVGSGVFCNSSVGTETAAVNTIVVSPNPFTSTIRLSGLSAEAEVSLFNGLGQVIYQGKSIENQDFSALNAGLYYLKASNFFVKLSKQ